MKVDLPLLPIQHSNLFVEASIKEREVIGKQLVMLELLLSVQFFSPPAPVRMLV